MFKMANMLIKAYVSKKAREYDLLRSQAANRYYEELYETERKDLHLLAREIFKKLCQQGRIRCPQQKDLRKLLEELLGGYLEEYKGMRFQNEFHRIYTYMKSYHIDEKDWYRILSYLEQVHLSS